MFLKIALLVLFFAASAECYYEEYEYICYFAFIHGVLLLYSVASQQCVDGWLLPTESFVESHWMFGCTA